jgi:hypothetical protein
LTATSEITSTEGAAHDCALFIKEKREGLSFQEIKAVRAECQQRDGDGKRNDTQNIES